MKNAIRTAITVIGIFLTVMLHAQEHYSASCFSSSTSISCSDSDGNSYSVSLNDVDGAVLDTLTPSEQIKYVAHKQAEADKLIARLDISAAHTDADLKAMRLSKRECGKIGSLSADGMPHPHTGVVKSYRFTLKWSKGTCTAEVQ